MPNTSRLQRVAFALAVRRIPRAESYTRRVITCGQCARENPADARFCNGCGAPLAAETRVREERKLVTAVFVDLVGSTARAEQLDPEDVRALLRRYHDTLRRELERYGGAVEKFIGDAVVAVYGAPTAHEDDPERAVRAALAVRDSIAALNERDDALDSMSVSASRRARRSSRSTPAPGRGLDGRRRRHEHRGADPVRRAGGRDPRRRHDPSRDGAHHRLPCSRARRGEGQGRAGRGLGGRRGARPGQRPRRGSHVAAGRS